MTTKAKIALVVITWFFTSEFQGMKNSFFEPNIKEGLDELGTTAVLPILFNMNMIFEHTCMQYG